MATQKREVKRKPHSNNGRPARPTLLDACGRKYVVRWCDEQEWAVLHEADGQRGFTDHVANMVYMRTFVGRIEGEPAAESSLQETLLHEAIHCVMYVANLCEPVTRIKDMEDGDGEEYIVENLANPMLYLLTNNDPLLKWLAYKEV